MFTPRTHTFVNLSYKTWVKKKKKKKTWVTGHLSQKCFLHWDSLIILLLGSQL